MLRNVGFYIVFMALCSFTYSYDIDIISKNKFVQAGSSQRIEIECVMDASLSTERYFIYSWIKSGIKNSVTISHGDSVIVSDTRYDLNLFEDDVPSKIKYKLSIRDVELSDNGTYECVVKNRQSGFTESRNTTIFVISNSVINKVVLEGDDAYLPCFTEDYNLTNVKWFRLPKTIPEGSSTMNKSLIIHSAQTNDSGEYLCSAIIHFDHVQLPVSRIIKLTVTPTLNIKVRNGVLSRPIGYEVNITCLIYSLSPVNVYWGKDSEYGKIESRCNIDILTRTVEDPNEQFLEPHLTIAGLRIRNINNEDYGRYECFAHNEFGSATASTTLDKPPT